MTLSAIYGFLLGAAVGLAPSLYILFFRTLPQSREAARVEEEIQMMFSNIPELRAKAELLEYGASMMGCVYSAVDLHPMGRMKYEEFDMKLIQVMRFVTDNLKGEKEYVIYVHYSSAPRRKGDMVESTLEPITAIRVRNDMLGFAATVQHGLSEDADQAFDDMTLCMRHVMGTIGRWSPSAQQDIEIPPGAPVH